MKAVNKILKKYGERVVKQAKINVGSSKNPNGGKRIDSTGTLRNSISVKVTDGEAVFYMEDYGKLRDRGQLGNKRQILKGWNKSVFKRTKGFTSLAPKPQPLKNWIGNKPLKFRDLKTGQFKPRFHTITRGPNKGKQADGYDTMSYLIGQKIKKKGIQPGLFFSEAWNKEYPDLADDIAQAFGDELEIRLREI